MRAELVDVESSGLQRAGYATVFRGEHAVQQVAHVDSPLTAIDGDRQSAVERELGRRGEFRLGPSRARHWQAEITHGDADRSQASFVFVSERGDEHLMVEAQFA